MSKRQQDYLLDILRNRVHSLLRRLVHGWSHHFLEENRRRIKIIIDQVGSAV